MKEMKYIPSPTGLAFHNSVARIKAISGSPGSGKSVTASLEIMYLAMRQQPDNDGIRKIRAGVLRNTYPELKKTTRKTIVEWLPDGSGAITNSAPMEGIIRWALPDGTSVEIDYQFLSMDHEKDLNKLDSMELSVIYMNEANHMTENHFIKCVERIGRYPPRKDGAGCTEPTLLIDFNLPDRDHWLNKYFVQKAFQEVFDNQGNPVFTKDDLEYFQQPAPVICLNYDDVEHKGATPKYKMNPDVENLQNLPDGYYERQLALNTWATTKARLLMMWVSESLGKVIHPEFDTNLHVAVEPLKPLRRETVYIGFDPSGVHPCAVLGQHIAGQLRITHELFGGDASIEDFVEGLLLPTLAADYPQCPRYAILDPSNPRQSSFGTLMTPTEILTNKYHIECQIAPGGNNMDIRINVMHRLLTRTHALLIDPDCKQLIKGLDSKYVFKGLMQPDGEMLYIKKKVDNEYGHYVDSLQNIVLYLFSHAEREAEMAQSSYRVKRRRMI